MHEMKFAGRDVAAMITLGVFFSGDYFGEDIPMRQRKIKNIEERLNDFSALTINNPQHLKGKWKTVLTMTTLFI